MSLATVLLPDSKQRRETLVEQQLIRRGLNDPVVLDAMRSVPREAFLPPELLEFAYEDTALPIGHEQTISQPLIVALMTEALELTPEDRVLEVGTGSGYAAAVLAAIAREVYTIERYRELAGTAAERLADLGHDNVHVKHGDGTRGWPEEAPFDAIVVAAGGPEVPRALLDQLAVGGRLVMPVGERRDGQQLLRIRKHGTDDFEPEELLQVRFVPLIGAGGWQEEWPGAPGVVSPESIVNLIAEEAEPIRDAEGDDLGPLLERIGDSRLVLIGEATHGTSEFYRMRARITRELIRRRGFRFVAVEADWPDAYRINRYVQRTDLPRSAKWDAFARFPTWMWRNREMLDFVEWLREHNEEMHEPGKGVAVYGLDLYSLYTSIHAVLDYLDVVNPEAAQQARERYGCLSPWEGDPSTYGRAVLSGEYRSCELPVTAMLHDLLQKRVEYAEEDGDHFFDAARNARVVANAEQYYRVMYYGGRESWNLRDRHMFETLCSLLRHHGANARGVVWEHNSHLGDAAATEMGASGEINVGHLCRQQFGQEAYLIGQGTDHGTVAAARFWDAPVEVMRVQPALPESYEELCHHAGLSAFFLHLRKHGDLREQLEEERLERAIGVIYRPQTERHSHYFKACLPRQFDEYIWFDRTEAVRPILPEEARKHAPAHPFALID
jgi:protein-L-isoaspartate(D-aspartate) O-methyltransferase